MNAKLGFAAFAIATAATAAAGSWCVSRAIVGEAESPQVVSVPLDDAVFALAQDALADVRVLDAGGREVPRVVQPVREVPVARPCLERVAVEAAQVAVRTEEKTTTLTVPAGRHPVVGVALAPEQENFERRVSVEAPAPGGWRTLAQGVVSRVRLPDMVPQDSLDARFPEIRAERLRIQIANDDNPPLTFGEGGVTLVRPAYAVAFIAEKWQRYRLVYGNPSPMSPPVYERGVVHYLDQGRAAATWTLAAPPDGPVAYSASVRAWQFLARHALTLTSLFVMVALGLLILRAVKMPSS